MTDTIEKPKKLDDLYREYELVRPNQFKKIPLAERDLWEAVSFAWGDQLVTGWKVKDIGELIAL